MLFVSPTSSASCPYRDLLRIENSSGCISWYQLLGVNASSGKSVLRRRFQERRKLIRSKIRRSPGPVWERLLEELEQAVVCLSNPQKRAAYDRELCAFRQRSVQHEPACASAAVDGFLSESDTEDPCDAPQRLAADVPASKSEAHADEIWFEHDSVSNIDADRLQDSCADDEQHAENGEISELEAQILLDVTMPGWPEPTDSVTPRFSDGVSSADCAPSSQPVHGSSGFGRSSVKAEPLELIGRGNDGTRVYAAYDEQLSRTVAVKCLNKAARTLERRKQFLNEARFLDSVSHPNLVEVHAVDHRRTSFTMELLPKSLAEHAGHVVKRDRCDYVLEFLRQALSVLQCLHDRGVTHGALRLHSFRVAETGTVKLTDAPGCTQSGFFRAPVPDQICVAPELLSPESFGQPGLAVDLYMLGFAAVELLAGENLLKWFRKVDSQAQWLRWHGSPFEQLPNLEEFLPEIPSSLAQVLERLCRKQVAERYRSATAALNDLIPQVVVAGPTTASESSRRPVQAAASEAVENVGGAPPLLVEAQEDVDSSHDLLEILQDPALLWQTLQRNRIAQLTAGMILSLFILICLVPTGSAVEANVSDRSLNVPPPESASPSEPDTGALPPEPEPEKIAFPDLVQSPVYRDLQPVPEVPTDLSSPSSHPLPPEAPVPAAAPTVQLIRSPFPEPFQVFGIARDDKAQEFADALTELSRARTSRERDALLADAQRLAPQDPRPAFVYAATFHFRDVRDSLDQAVLLSDHRFTQAFRVDIENTLRGPWRAADMTDKTFARLTRFRDLLQDPPVTPQSHYDWQWIGRVVRFCELTAGDNAEMKNMIVANLERMSRASSALARAHIRCGYDSVQFKSRTDFMPEVFFPRQPETEIALCLQTLEGVPSH